MNELTPLGIIGGSAFVEGPAPRDTTARVAMARSQQVTMHEGTGYFFLRRHGEAYRPPHRVTHTAHALALRSLGAPAAVGLCSVGALDPSLGLGSVVVPDDYLSLAPPPTLADGDQRLHIVPALDPELRSLLLDVAREVVADGDENGGGVQVVDGGVYAETRGPRFETRAEVRLLTDYADVVGMTAASEATLCQEAGLRYAALCIVDNLAHGIGVDPLTPARFEAQLDANRARARRILDAIIERIRESSA